MPDCVIPIPEISRKLKHLKVLSQNFFRYISSNISRKRRCLDYSTPRQIYLGQKLRKIQLRSFVQVFLAFYSKRVNRTNLLLQKIINYRLIYRRMADDSTEGKLEAMEIRHTFNPVGLISVFVTGTKSYFIMV